MTGNFIVYLIGYIIVIVGVAYGMSAAGLGEKWILPVVLVMAGLGIIYALAFAGGQAIGLELIHAAANDADTDASAKE